MTGGPSGESEARGERSASAKRERRWSKSRAGCCRWMIEQIAKGE